VSERAYIRAEARSLVERSTQGLQHNPSQDAVRRALAEGESRLALAIHYKIPYPRHHNVLPGQSGVGARPVTPMPQH
jgi:hypothetical protein